MDLGYLREDLMGVDLQQANTRRTYPVQNLVLLVTWVVAQMVADADAVTVDAVLNGTELLLRLRVAPEEQSRFGGPDWELIDALRVITQEIGALHGYTCFVEVEQAQPSAE